MKDQICDMNISDDSNASDMEIGFLIKIISEQFQANAARDMKENNLTLSQIETLIFIHSHEGRVSQKNIETFLRVSHPTVVGIVSRLEKRGFVTTELDQKDRRNKIVCTTERADAQRDDYRAQQLKMEQQLSDGMTDEEVDELKRLLMKVYQNIK